MTLEQTERKRRAAEYRRRVRDEATERLAQSVAARAKSGPPPTGATGTVELATPAPDAVKRPPAAQSMLAHAALPQTNADQIFGSLPTDTLHVGFMQPTSGGDGTAPERGRAATAAQRKRSATKSRSPKRNEIASAAAGDISTTATAPNDSLPVDILSASITPGAPIHATLPPSMGVTAVTAGLTHSHVPPPLVQMQVPTAGTSTVGAVRGATAVIAALAASTGAAGSGSAGVNAPLPPPPAVSTLQQQALEYHPPTIRTRAPASRNSTQYSHIKTLIIASAKPKSRKPTAPPTSAAAAAAASLATPAGTIGSVGSKPTETKRSTGAAGATGTAGGPVSMAWGTAATPFTAPTDYVNRINTTTLDGTAIGQSSQSARMHVSDVSASGGGGGAAGAAKPLPATTAMFAIVNQNKPRPPPTASSRDTVRDPRDPVGSVQVPKFVKRRIVQALTQR